MNFITDLINQYRPAAERAAAEARMYANTICVTLEATVQAIRDMERTDEYAYVNVVLPASPGRVELGTVPPGQVWELELLSGSEVTTAFNITVRADDLHIARYSGSISLPGGLAAPRFVGPCTITAGHTMATPQNVRAQFRVLKPRPRRTVAGGQIMAGIAATAAERHHAERHEGIGVG